MHFRNLNVILDINISDRGFRHWVAMKPNPVSSGTRTKLKHFN